MFQVGDVVRDPRNKDNNNYYVKEVDTFTQPIPLYTLTDGMAKFYNFCVGWSRVVFRPNEAFNKGEILFYREFFNEYKDLIDILFVKYEDSIRYRVNINHTTIETGCFGGKELNHE